MNNEQAHKQQDESFSIVHCSFTYKDKSKRPDQND